MAQSPFLDVSSEFQPELSDIQRKQRLAQLLTQQGMQTPQAFGSASSYGKKYALGNLLLIDDTADSDATNTHGQATMTSEQLKKAQEYVKSGGKVASIKKKYSMTPEQEKQLTTL